MRKTTKYKATFGALATLDTLIAVYGLVFAVGQAVEGGFKMALIGLVVAASASAAMAQHGGAIRRISDSETAEALRRLRDAANREAGGSRH